MNRALVYILLLSTLFSACTANKYLQEDQKYYAGAEVKFSPYKKVEDNIKIKDRITTLLRPDPNSKLLGSRPRVWFYYLAGDVQKEKGFKHWMKTKLGRPPVHYEDVEPARTSRQIETTLRNSGFFDARVSYSTKSTSNTTKVIYAAELTSPYHYDSVEYAMQDESLNQAVTQTVENSLVKPGYRYDLIELKNERTRIETVLKDRGYYLFDDQYLLFRADSTVGDKQVDIYMKVKDSTPEEAKTVFTLGEVNVFPDYAYGESEKTIGDTTKVDQMNYIQSKDQFRPEIIAEQVALQKGDIYRKEHELITLDRLIQLDVFKFVNIDYQQMGDQQLRANVYLTPYKKKAIRLELQAVSKSNNFVGPNFKASFKNRNAFRGAELYELNFDAGYEIQVGGAQSEENQGPLNSYSLGIENVLRIPRIISPFNIRNRSSRYVPQTVFKLGFRTLKRINYFTLNSINAAYGFNWRETKRKRHELYPVNVDYIKLGKTSAEFDSILVANPLLRKSYEEQFILGTSYGFFYNTQSDDDRTSRSDFYFNANIDLSGNLMHVAQSAVRDTANSEEEPYELFGSPYAQFVKTDIDFRYFYKTGKDSKIATRLIAGVGYAYGNSITLPYTKQFTIGGSNSIRAFRARSVGPGTYEEQNATFVDQTADIKLEGNLEYRFPIIGFFKGALFIDAGNIWTLREDEQRPGSQFDSGQFLSELAVGTGFGLRIDVDFFVLRFDLAFPLRVPSESGERWKFSDIALSDSDWRKQNLVFNIAIGYPF